MKGKFFTFFRLNGAVKATATCQENVEEVEEVLDKVGVGKVINVGVRGTKSGCLCMSAPLSGKS